MESAESWITNSPVLAPLRPVAVKLPAENVVVPPVQSASLYQPCPPVPAKSKVQGQQIAVQHEGP
jgi:hypothetical protein